MEEGCESLKDLERKVGRKTPDGLLRWMRGDCTARLMDGDISARLNGDGMQADDKGLDQKIRDLKVDMVHLRSVDVKILQQLLAVHEGIESVKWLMEERSTLTSHCSSLTGSQYSLGEGPDTSLRGSWSSLHDLHDKLDSVSIGSYLDTLADDMDEYCPSSSESVPCLTSLGTEMSSRAGAGATSGSPRARAERSRVPPSQDSGFTLSPKAKPFQNGKIELDGCKHNNNNKMHLECDTHWHWVQSQDDVTFL